MGGSVCGRAKHHESTPGALLVGGGGSAWVVVHGW